MKFESSENESPEHSGEHSPESFVAKYSGENAGEILEDHKYADEHL